MRFRDARATLWPRCLDAVAAVRREMDASEGAFSITGLSVPALDDTRAGKLWTLWFDCAGDEQFWYGVQSDDDWQTLAAFADD